MPRRPLDAQERDLLLLLALRSGEPGAAAALYDAHAPLTFSICAAILPRPADASQAFRNGWREVWKRAASYDRREGTVELWLVQLMREAAFERLRGLEPQGEGVALVTAGRGTAGAAPAATTRERSEAAAAMAALPPLERQVIALGFFRAMDAGEIAAQVEAPVGTVWRWLQQGLARLRSAAPVEERV